MSKQKSKADIEKKIKNCLEKAEESPNSEITRENIRKARRLAMHFKIKLPKEAKKKFCRKCNNFFNSRNRKIRLKKGFLVFHCLNCGGISRYKAGN